MGTIDAVFRLHVFPVDRFATLITGRPQFIDAFLRAAGVTFIFPILTGQLALADGAVRWVRGDPCDGAEQHRQ